LVGLQKKDEDDLWKQTRPRILDMLGEHGEQSIILESNKRMEDYEKDKSLSLDLATIVFKYWLQSHENKEAASKRMIEIYEKATASTESSPELTYKALICVGYSSNTDSTLNYILESDIVRPQDFLYPLGSVCSTLAGRELSWKFIQTNWEKVTKKVSTNLLISVINQTTNFHTIEKLKEVEEFFSTRTTKEIERAVKNRLESIRTNIITVDLQKENTIQYLKANYS